MSAIACPRCGAPAPCGFTCVSVTNRTTEICTACRGDEEFLAGGGDPRRLYGLDALNRPTRRRVLASWPEPDWDTWRDGKPMPTSACADARARDLLADEQLFAKELLELLAEQREDENDTTRAPETKP